MRMDRLSTLVLLAGLTGSNAMAQDKNFDGTWNLNVAKSFMGTEHPSSNYQLLKKIDLKDGLVSITDSYAHATMVGIPLPDTKTTMEFAADGKEHDIKMPSAFPGIPEVPEKVSAVWQGCTLEIHETIAAFGSSTKQRLFLSADGSQLIVLVEGHSTFMDTEQRLIFDKKN